MAQVEPPLQLWIVGRDSLAKYQREAARLGVSDRVRFWGGQDDVAAFYAAADFFVLPTWYDPFPSVALEAMASGLPIIVTRQCGAAEVIQPSREGFILDHPNDPQLISYMQRLVEQHEDMTQAARLSAERFPIHRTVSETLALYHRLLGITA